MDIPNFEAVVDNEFANIDQSYKEFKESGIVNAYTKGESNKNMDELNALANTTSALAR